MQNEQPGLGKTNLDGGVVSTTGSILKQYEDLVLKNLEVVGYCESSCRTLLFFLISRFKSSELAMEIGYSAVGLFGLLHDLIVLRHFQTRYLTALRSKSSQTFTQLRVGVPELCTKFALPLSILKQVELPLEIWTKKRFGEKAQWITIFLVEILRVVLRLSLIYKTQKTMLVHQSIPGRERYPPLPVVDETQSPHSESDPNFRNQPPFDPQKKKEKETLWKVLITNHVKPTQLNDTRFLAELLYIFRPLAYASALYVFKKKSWKPWFISLLVEFSSRTLVGDSEKLNPLEKDEFLRRSSSFPYYLLRSPFFETVTESPLGKKFDFVQSIPLLGSICDYVMTYRDYYFFTSAS